MPERSFFDEEHRKLHGIGTLRRRVSKDSAVMLYLNSKPGSRAILDAFMKSGQDFNPQIAKGRSPYVDFAGERWTGVEKVLAFQKGLKAFDEVILKSLDEINASQANEQDTSTAEWSERETRFVWAYAEAIVEGRPMTPLSKDYQERDQTRSWDSLLAVGQADVDMRPFTMLRDADGNRNVLFNCDDRNIASWLAIAEADQEQRQYTEVNFSYHQQMLLYKSRSA